MKELKFIKTQKCNQNPLITIKISKYLTDDLCRKIAAAGWHSSAPEWVDRVIWSVYEGHCYHKDCFNVIAQNTALDVVGRLYAVNNDENPKLWYHGDLFVADKYRRMGIATAMLKEAIEKISDEGGEILHCFIDNDNEASLALQLIRICHL
jgi:ribosomal protein S18 acetylase RimI-like enzyme